MKSDLYFITNLKKHMIKSGLNEYNKIKEMIQMCAGMLNAALWHWKIGGFLKFLSHNKRQKWWINGYYGQLTVQRVNNVF